MPLAPFVEELPRLPVAIPVAGAPADEVWYEIDMRQTLHDFHPQATQIPVWAYDGHYPGPVIDAQAHRLVQITWINRLPTGGVFPFRVEPPLAQAMQMHGAASTMAHMGDMHNGDMHPGTDEMLMARPGQAVTHLHGAHVPWQSDGFPHCLLFPEDDAGQTGAGRSSRSTCRYPNHQRGALLWYHDHAIGITRLNVYAGLAGAYILREPDEAALHLPSGAYEIPLVIQDRLFDSPDAPTQLVHHVDPVEQMEFFGDHIVVNGKVWPKLTVEARKYRLRVLNGSNSRFYSLSLRMLTGSALRPALHQIGTDGGFLPRPVPLGTGSMAAVVLSPAERADLIIDFSGCQPGDEILLANDAPAPYPTGSAAMPYNPDRADVGTTGAVLKFVVAEATAPDESRLPAVLPVDDTTTIGNAQVHLRDLPAVAKALEAAGLPPIRIRKHLTLTETPDGKVLLNNKGWMAPVDEEPLVNSVEVWEIENLTPDTHPIHLHLIQFLLLDRVTLADGTPRPASDAEMGWKDTILCHPRERTRVVAHFTDYPGWYVWHCHMLEHEDHDMMRPLYVRAADEAENASHPFPCMDTLRLAQEG